MHSWPGLYRAGNNVFNTRFLQLGVYSDSSRARLRSENMVPG